MPMTLPAHAAAALPFTRVRWLHAHALVAGCCAPDVAYLFNISRNVSHGFTWGIPCGVLVGLCTFVWAELLVLPGLANAGDSVLYVDLVRLLAVKWPPLSWLGVVCAIAVGTVTHLVWDGFTHAGWWPARVIYPDSWSYFGPRFAWRWSTIVGTLLVFWFLWRRYRGPRLLDVHPLAWAGALTTLAATLAAFIVGYRVLPRDLDVPHWPAQVMAMRIGFSVFTLWCWFFKNARAVRDVP